MVYLIDLFIIQKLIAELKLTQQKQHQQNYNHKAETAAAVVASTVKRASADSTETAQQRDYQDDENDGPNRHP